MDLAALTTLELGGPARHFIEVDREADLARALRWADHKRLPVFILGGGSNVLVADRGYDGLVIKLAMLGVQYTQRGATTIVTAAAGENFDALVAQCVARDLAGLECLSGIPGLVGAVPIQNVGAYGQEISQCLHSVRVLERSTLTVKTLSPDQCQLTYRDSAFKRNPLAHVVLSVAFQLSMGGAALIRYGELSRAIEEGGDDSLAAVRRTVIDLRRRKSMVIDPADPNRRSAGSFFTNPILPDAQADQIVQDAVAAGLVTEPSQVPRYPAGAGHSKLAAGWLIEQAGFQKGHRHRAVGISSNHCLALVHHGGGSAEDLVALALFIQEGVYSRFGVRLEPEPVVVGFSGTPF